jgi:hypothetical protein
VLYAVSQAGQLPPLLLLVVAVLGAPPLPPLLLPLVVVSGAAPLRPLPPQQLLVVAACRVPRPPTAGGTLAALAPPLPLPLLLVSNWERHTLHTCPGMTGDVMCCLPLSTVP